MKKNFLMTILSALCVACCSLGFALTGVNAMFTHAEVSKTIDMYLIAGQSNAAGYSYHNNTLDETFENVGYAGETDKKREDDTASSSNVTWFKDFYWGVKAGYGRSSDRIGPEYGMAKVLNPKYSTSNPAFIFKSAAGGTSLRDLDSGESATYGNWYPKSNWASGFTPSSSDTTGLQYHNFVENFRTVYTQLENNGYRPQVKGMVWMQGCSDLSSDSSVVSTYETLLENFISDIRTDLQTITGDNSLDEMPFVIGKIATTVESYNNPKVPAFNAMQQRIADRVTAVETIETSDLIVCKEGGGYGGVDAWHFSAADAVTLGQRFAEKLVEMNNAGGDSVENDETKSTWTDSETGKTYTFAGDITTFTTTDIGDLDSPYKNAFGTAEGLSGSATNQYFDDNESIDALVNLRDQDWVKNTGGIHFRFNTDNEWYTPKFLEMQSNGTMTEVNAQEYGRLEIIYGDLVIYLGRNQGEDRGNGEFQYNLKTDYLSSRESKMSGQSLTPGTNQNKQPGIVVTDTNFNWFTYNPEDGNYYQDGWAQVKISKYKCTAVSDGSMPTGYWLKIAYGKPGQEEFTNPVYTYNGYVSATMYNDGWDNFVIRNSTMQNSVRQGNIIADPAYENYDCKMSIKRGDAAITAEWDAETYKDVADYGLSVDYVNGIVMQSTDRLTNANDVIPNGTDASVGLEIRYKHHNDFINADPNNTVEQGFFGAYVGATYLLLRYDRHESQLSIWGYNRYKGVNILDQHTALRWGYDINAEYVMRITRIAARPLNASDDGKGALIRLYLGKVDPNTNMPEEGWDKVAMFEIFDVYERYPSGYDVNRQGLGIANYSLQDGNKYQHTVTFCSNKYIPYIKTLVDGKTTTYTHTKENPIERGEFKIPEEINVSTANTFFIGWGVYDESTKKLLDYSDCNVISINESGEVVEGVTKEAVYVPLTIRMEADEKASLRIRYRKLDENGQPTIPELSLQWNIKAYSCPEFDLALDLSAYKEALQFGYKFTANGKFLEDDVPHKPEYFNNFTATKPYEYSITQSSISAKSFHVNFLCQAYLTFEGVTYYTTLPNAVNARSVDFVADAAANDYKDSSQGIYTNKIQVNGETKYHYFTQEIYDLVAWASQVTDLRSVDTNGTFVDERNGYRLAYNNAIKDDQGNIIGYHYLTQEKYDTLIKNANA